MDLQAALAQLIAGRGHHGTPRRRPHRRPPGGQKHPSPAYFSPLARIEALADFQRVMVALALRSGQVLNQSEVARDAALPQPTVHRYLNLLEASHLLERLPAYAVSRTKRLAPKVYWADPALAAHLAGYYDTESVRTAREYGAFFETVVLHHPRISRRSMWGAGARGSTDSSSGREDHRPAVDLVCS